MSARVAVGAVILAVVSNVVVALGNPNPEGVSTDSPLAADLLFSSNRDGNFEIYLLRAGQTEWTNLSHYEAEDSWPVWSPDGTRIAFQRGDRRRGNLDIWTMKADGSEQVQLTDDDGLDSFPSWSPDGKSIFFTSSRKEPGESEGTAHAYTMDADGSNERRLVKQALPYGAMPSPDGKLIAFARRGEKGADIYVADAEGNNERRLTNDQVDNGLPTFSPDGKWIAFSSSDERSAAALVVMTVDGRSRRAVVAAGHNWYPRWSPDGRWLVYYAGKNRIDVDIFAVPASGEDKPVRLVGGPQREQDGSWRPVTAATFMLR